MKESERNAQIEIEKKSGERALCRYRNRIGGSFSNERAAPETNNIVSIVAKLGNICFGCKSCVRETKMILTSGENNFCFRAVSTTYVSRAAKLGNICLHINVSATMFPSLTRP